jgi:spore maturation protein CgeB
MAEPTEERLRKLRKELHPLVEKVARLLSTSRMSFEEAVKSLDIDISHLPVQERIDFEAAAIWRATLLYRLSCVEMLKGFEHHIHGDRGWDKLLSKDYKLYPPLNYYKELPLFYNACRVNLNATSLQMGGAVNQRAFDVPACGGFLLTDQQEELSELFEEGKEVITYKEKGEIPELVRFYLDNSDKRKTVAQRARDRVLSQHTYRHRLNSMIESMRKRYAV